jgi:hypothetical protein
MWAGHAWRKNNTIIKAVIEKEKDRCTVVWNPIWVEKSTFLKYIDINILLQEPNMYILRNINTVPQIILSVLGDQVD